MFPTGKVVDPVRGFVVAVPPGTEDATAWPGVEVGAVGVGLAGGDGVGGGDGGGGGLAGSASDDATKALGEIRPLQFPVGTHADELHKQFCREHMTADMKMKSCQQRPVTLELSDTSCWSERTSAG